VASSDIQVEKGHSKIAHPILEALALAPFQRAHLKVMLVVIRESYGWSRKDAALSLGVLQQATGLHRNSVARTVRELVQAGVLVCMRGPQGTRPAVYRIQKDPRLWGPFSVTPVTLEAPPTVTPPSVSHPTVIPAHGDSSITLGGDSSVTPHGDRHRPQGTVPQRVTGPENKKQKARYKTLPRRAAATGASWSKEAATDWDSRFGLGSAPAGKIGKQLKRIVDKHGWDVVRPAWRAYLAQREPQFADAADFAAKFGVWRARAPAAPQDRRELLREALAQVRRQDPGFTGGLPDEHATGVGIPRRDYELWNEVLREAGLAPIPKAVA